MKHVLLTLTLALFALPTLTEARQVCYEVVDYDDIYMSAMAAADQTRSTQLEAADNALAAAINKLDAALNVEVAAADAILNPAYNEAKDAFKSADPENYVAVLLREDAGEYIADPETVSVAYAAFAQAKRELFGRYTTAKGEAYAVYNEAKRTAYKEYTNAKTAAYNTHAKTLVEAEADLKKRLLQ